MQIDKINIHTHTHTSKRFQSVLPFAVGKMILASMDVSDVTDRWRMKATKGGNASCLATTESIEEHDKLHVRMRTLH